MKYDGPCECKAAMRPRWSRDAGPKVYMCIRCGRPVPGYERMWWMREKLKEKEGNRSQSSKF